VDGRQRPRSSGYAGLPAEDITIDQVVAWNMRHWRRSARMTQEELGERIGWSAGNISAAERSVEEHRDRRRFDAQTLAAIADALGIPIIALFLPPADDGSGKRYQWQAGGGKQRDMAYLMRLAMHDSNQDTGVMDEYRDRFRGAVTTYLDASWGAEAGRWFAPADDRTARIEAAARFRSRQEAFLRMADEEAEIAGFLEEDGERPS
jgi:transcriptional regulator with XRE-family HTH domain